MLGHFSNGTEILPENLAGLRVLAPQLPLQRQKKVLNDLAGTHTAAVRGRGIDFSEVREYLPGDDIRSMDWRVTARTGDAHIKLFREERERPVLIICDLRSSMDFGTRRTLKRVLAADIAALLSWSALAKGDRIGGLLFNDTTELDLRPRTGRKSLMNLLHQLSSLDVSKPNAAQPQNPAQRMADICKHVSRIAHPGSAVYFISDWLGFDAQAERLIYPLTRHCDLTAIHISDPFEQSLPAGRFTLTDGQQRQVLDASSQNTRNAHQQHWDAQQLILGQHLQRLQVPLIRISTADDPLPLLRKGLGLTKGSKR
ncbi:MAG: hypothetical protein ACJAYO_000224 [Thalassolituus oleivorans]|jgi:uncharacterized protein (DUF58 family)